MEQGHKMDPKTKEMVHTGYYFTILTEVTDFSRISECTSIPEEVLVRC